jgi:Undecaprenyl-phosphate galactose phosphotransferase WbaP
MEIVARQVDTNKKEGRFSSVTTFLSQFTSTWMGFVLLFSDIMSLILAGDLALLLWSYFNKNFALPSVIGIILYIFIIIVVYAIAGLYPAVGISPVEEIRLTVISTTAVFLLFGTVSFYLDDFGRYSSVSIGLAWIFALIFVPIIRNIFRSLFSSLGLWGEPIAFIGYGELGNRIKIFLDEYPKYGYRPTVIVDGFSAVDPTLLKNIKFQRSKALPLKDIHLLDRIKTAIIITPDLPKEFLNEVIEGRWHKFRHLIVITDVQNGGSAWIKTQDLGGVLGLKIQQNLSNGVQKYVKRTVDLLMVILASPFLFVLFSLLILLVRLDSRGPVIYRQKRLGKDGKEFIIWKFRTMAVDADQMLEKYFASHPELKTEWNDRKKIRNDPRVTRAGRILRRLSLDELPQIYNIVRGEMSMVGPRPIVEEEIHYYNDCYNLYTRVKPGLTGLWQVSGRNDMSYQQRVSLDEYYVNNWSIWLDFFILFQTIKAVLTGKGAY